MATIRDYNVTVSNTEASIEVTNTKKTSYAALPTIAEIQSVTGNPVKVINLRDCFSSCSSLTTAPEIPSGVTSMDWCFYGCRALTTAPAIPSSVTNMRGCFYNCSSLTTAPTIPSGVTDMYWCFYGCSKLTTAPEIPSGVTNMYGCFSGCSSLTTAPTIPSSVTDMQRCFSGCRALTTAPTIPSGVTNLYECFSGCRALTTAPAIPSGVTDMHWCFYDCSSLTTAPAIPSSVTDISNCFDSCTALTTVSNIPNSVTNMNHCFGGCTALTTIPTTIPSSVTSMSSCFRGCSSLTTAPTIPNSVTDMDYCFAYCDSLTGKVVINANPSTYTDCMMNTQKEILLVGSSTQLQNIANTATNNNVYVWSLSINLSAERQEDDFSKANVSVTINRFRNNNESVSLTFTIDGVESTPVQVTMDTATKTYTGVLSISPFSTVELSVIAEDSYGKSAPKSIAIPIPFYTIDFQAGGKEIAVGTAANDNLTSHPNGLFKCVMDAQFGGNAEFDGNLALGTPLSIANGGTGATTASDARTNLGLNQNIITAKPSGDVTRSGTGDSKIPVVKANSVGDKFTVTSGSVYVGSGISKVLVSAHAKYQCKTGIKNLAIRKNGTSVVEINQNATFPSSAALPLAITPVLLDVTEGDYFELWWYGASGDTMQAPLTRMTIEAVE